MCIRGTPYYDDVAEIEDYIVDKNLAACNSEYHTLDQISGSIDGIPDHCFDTYIAQVELEILNKALNDFDAIVGDGYDRKFDIYERVVRDQAPASVDAYMSSAQATGIWHCNSNKYVSCCKDCAGSWGCAVGCDKSQDCVAGKRQTPVDCPTRISDPYDIYSTPPDELFYTVSDQNKFFTDISEKFGVLMDWVAFGDRTAWVGQGCQFAGADVDECIRDHSIFWHGYPVVGNVSVPNPKTS